MRKSNIKLFYTLVFSFFLISSTTILTIKLKGWGNAPRGEIHETPRRVLAEQVSLEDLKLPDVPIMKEGVVMPSFSAQSVLAKDLDSDKTLYEKNIDLPLFPASTTKVITALVALDYYSLDNIVKVQDVDVIGQKMRLVEGEEISIRDLLYGLLVYSANDAAEALAQNYDGGRSAFIEAMNRKVAELGLKSSHFTNPSGLDTENQFTTAEDLIRVTKIAMENPFFRDVVKTKSIDVKSTDGRFIHKLTNINALLGRVDGVLGVKTGWTENARENLVTYIERDGRKVMIALLGSEDRFGETKSLISWIFLSYSWENPEDLALPTP
jgi:D-alanyl-D-alanine carboxypeptidase (penicillin-binding protein 5/6)